ncbi:MBL fold metallo-hydrolase [Clostridium minihomine]|uniref:MBL fold metallo-hydrolase n=1 Tax=Clostridium minihomine TaxID=2045012 RepID=UPI000C75B2FC|nr:MBL fold metallo-hydrolase [Clostridium minihomine]
MQLKQLTDRVFYSTHRKEADRPALGYINGKKYSLMVDAGNSKAHVELFHEAIAERGMRKPNFVAVTHWHWDHTFGMHAAEGVTICHKKTNEKLKEMAQWKWTDSEMANRLQTQVEIEFADTSIRNEYSRLAEIQVVTSAVTFHETMEIDLGDIVVELHHIPSPHSEGCICAWVPQERVLFIGDAIGVDYYNHCSLDKDKLQALTKAITAFDFTVCVMGHAEPMGKQEILDILSSLQAR